VNDHKADELSKRIASLEARFAGSWACQTREEYKKAIKQDLKQEIIGYLVKISVGLVIFLGGAGALLINVVIESTFQRENAALIKELQARYDAHVKQDVTRLDWERLHNYGVTYRYLAELYSASTVPDEVKTKKLQDIFDRAKTYYDLALEVDPKQPTTHFELAQIYHTYPIRFGVQSWKKDQAAIDEYRRAIDLMSYEDVSKAWRAEALTMLARSEANKHRELLETIEGELQQAGAEYARAVPQVSKYNVDYSATNDKLIKEVVCLKEARPEGSATCTEVSK
jgi:tetratricopeptide (TPR) repeat protein